MTSQQAKSCYLKSDDDSILTVYLPDQKPVFVGRSADTNIIDTECSRQQVRVCADYSEYKVTIQQVGKRSSGFNGFKTCKDVRFVGSHEDRLEILYGKYAYQIEFNPPPPRTPIALSKKRPIEQELDIEAQKSSSKITKFKEINTYDNIKNTHSIPQNSKNTSNTISKESSNTSKEHAQEVWESKDNKSLIIYTSAFVEGRSKIASFDMDGTLIKTRSGLVFPKDFDDWQLMYPDVPGKLKKLHADGYKIVIFTNQGAIGAGRLHLEPFKQKIQKIQRRINVPLQAFIATGNSIYRKPAIGMWQALEEQYNENVPIDKENSFYVGDAAGRAKNWAPGKKKDHSCVDRLMALNLGLKFQTPEEHFLGHKAAPYVLPAFKPSNLPTSDEVCSAENEVSSETQEMILMVGCPGSGKSHFAKHYLKQYAYVNRDTLGSWQKCVDAIEKHLITKKSVVVDNTNGDRKTRQRYLDVAKKYQVPVRCFIMSTSVDHAKHNNKFRELTDPTHVKIGDMIIHSYLKNYQPPSLDEGFSKIVKIKFVPKFQTEKDRKLYEMYLLEH